MLGLDNPIHIAFLLILLLLVFGAKRLPEMGRSLGSGMRGFKEALSGEGAQRSLLASPAAPEAASADAPVAAPVAASLTAPPSTPGAVSAAGTAGASAGAHGTGPAQDPTPPLAA